MRKILVLALAMPFTLLFLPASVGYAASSTTASMTFTEADGVTPMADAEVGIFYMSPAQAALPDGSTFTMTELWSGTTDSNGQFTAEVDTSSIPQSAMGDTGDGTPDAFNVEIEAIDPAGNFVSTNAVLTAGSTFSGSASVTIPATPGSALTASPSLSGNDTVIAHNYRYTPVTPLNSGFGIQAVLNYTTNQDTTRQTEVTVGESYDGGGWTTGGYWLEDQSRSVVAPLKESGSYHNWIWADYEYKEYKICAGRSCLYPTLEWKPYIFTGQLTDNNPDKDKSGVTIGVVPYTVPSFTPGAENQNWFALTQANSGWTRATGTREANDVNGGFTFPYAGNIGVDSLTSYGSITSVQYNWISSSKCGDGFQRVIWGHNSTPATTPRLQADCFSDSTLP